MKKGGFLLGCIILACGIMWSNLALAVVVCPAPSDCKKSTVLSKKAFSEAPSCFSCNNKCTNKGCDDIIVRIKRTATITSKDTGNLDICDDCDETEGLIPNGSKLIVDLTYHIRFAGPCLQPPTIHVIPVGTMTGKFTIKKPSGATVVTGIMMRGTIGFETHTDVDECGAWPHDEGYMEGNVTIPGAAGCKLMATFASDREGPPPFSQALPCNIEEWKNWTLKIDGLIQCKCP